MPEGIRVHMQSAPATAQMALRMRKSDSTPPVRSKKEIRCNHRGDHEGCEGKGSIDKLQPLSEKMAPCF
jgi:hypothetical protein